MKKMVPDPFQHYHRLHFLPQRDSESFESMKKIVPDPFVKFKTLTENQKPISTDNGPTPMFSIKTDRQRTLEFCLILICLGLTCLLHRVHGFRLVVLNLYYLPVVLAAFFLGRYRAGVLALFCVISATIITVLDLYSFAAYSSPITIGLAVTIWGAVMGLNALLVGTLSDERAKTIGELHDAYLGVVEVLSHYLNSADPQRHDRSQRVAELSVQVARQMKLSAREIDDIRVAALLQDLEHIEVTAKVIGKAIGDLGARPLHSSDGHTFQGSDLVHSLGSVLTGAMPLLMMENSSLELDWNNSQKRPAVAPFGARIIQTVRAFDSQMFGEDGLPMTPAEAIEDLKADLEGDHHPAVLHALEEVLVAKSPAPKLPPEPAKV